MIEITASSKLSVKELAGALGKSPGYLYKARMGGLPMEWDESSKCYVQTVGMVRRWIKRTHFRVVDGRGVKNE